MNKKKWPPIDPETVVKTTEPNMEMRKEWTDEGWASRQWGVEGTIITHHDSHGLCYEVKHPDGTIGYYDPSELETIGTKSKRKKEKGMRNGKDKLFAHRDKLFATVDEVVKRLLKLKEYKELISQNPPPIERKGGYFVLLDKIRRAILYKIMVGAPYEGSIKRYWDFSEEKARRLMYNRTHFSSWQTREVENGEFGGAVTAPRGSRGLKEGKRYILSFSGLPEMADEAICTVVAMIFRWITWSDAQKIMAVSGNTLIRPLLEACNDIY